MNIKKLFLYMVDELDYTPEEADEIINNDEYACLGTPEEYGEYLFEEEIAPALDSYWENTLRSVVDFYELEMADLNDINRFELDGEIYEISHY